MRVEGFRLKEGVNPIKLETGLRPNSAGIPYTLLLGIEAIGFPTFWLLKLGPYFGGPYNKDPIM